MTRVKRTLRWTKHKYMFLRDAGRKKRGRWRRYAWYDYLSLSYLESVGNCTCQSWLTCAQEFGRNGCSSYNFLFTCQVLRFAFVKKKGKKCLLFFHLFFKIQSKSGVKINNLFNILFFLGALRQLGFFLFPRHKERCTEHALCVWCV